MIITIARKPLIGSVCENTSIHQCGGINIEQTRISLPEQGSVSGRYPANLIINPDLSCFFPENAGGRRGKAGQLPTTLYFGTHRDFGFKEGCEKFLGDFGSASRFFFQVKE